VQGTSAAGTSGVRQFGAFPPHPTNVNQPLVSLPDQKSGFEQEIIPVLKRFASKIRSKSKGDRRSLTYDFFITLTVIKK
jgi:hypothetical protein